MIVVGSIVVGSIMVVGALTRCTLLPLQCDLKAALMNSQRWLILVLMLYEFELGRNSTKGIQNNYCAKGIFVSASHQTGIDTRSITPTVDYSGDLGEGKVGHELRLELCWTMLVNGPFSAM